MECRSAQEIYDELRQRFPDIRAGLVHGAMKQEEKDLVMESFSAGDTDLLVSTVVIEVGIDVKNATVMVIENCERFGLAQLHHCLLYTSIGRFQKIYCCRGRGDQENRGDSDNDDFFLLIHIYPLY